MHDIQGEVDVAMTAISRRETFTVPLAAAALAGFPGRSLAAITKGESGCATHTGAGTLLGDTAAREINAQAIRIFNSPAVRAARQRVAGLFAADTNAPIDRQRELVTTAADAHVYYASQIAVMERRSAPGFVWSLAPPVRWGDLTVPDSRYGIENPDNAYRLSGLQSGKRYRLRGHFAKERPSDFSVSILTKPSGDGNLATASAVIGYDMIDIAADGTFTIDIDPNPAAARRNHLSSADGQILLVRSTMGDWTRQTPGHLLVDEVDAPVPSRITYAPGAEERAASLGYGVAEYMLRVLQHRFYERNPLNTFPHAPEPSGPNGGLASQAASQATYRLKPGEALVVDADPRGVAYMGSQICDLWMLSYQYWHRLSSFNDRQAAVDADGRIRLVISAEDPGVYNWLDSGGHSTGTLTMRWQGIRSDTKFTPDSCRLSVVPLNALQSHLPAGTRRAPPAERDKQRAQRSCAFGARLA